MFGMLLSYVRDVTKFLMPAKPNRTPRFIFGTVGSPLGTPKRPGGSPGALEHIRALGLGALELGWVQSVRVSDETCARIRDTSRACSVPVSVHAPYFINLNAQSDDILERSRKRLLDAARAGWKAGATDIVFHAGGYMGCNPEDAYHTVRSRLSEIAETLRAERIAVTLRPETMGRSGMFGTLEECIRLSRDIDGVQPCVDFAHLHARPGDGSFNSYQEFSRAIRLIKKELGAAAVRAMHVHLSGIEYGPKGEKNHLPLRDSDLRFEELLKALADADAGGRILCESPILEKDALLLKQRYLALFS